MKNLKQKLKSHWQHSKLKTYCDAFAHAWENRAQIDEQKRSLQTLEFLPAALEVLERPVTPASQYLGRALMALFVIAIGWACIGELDIVAVAEGKIISSSRIKSIQPLEKGVVKAILVKEGQEVKAGQALVELDQTLTVAEQTRLTKELRSVQLNQQRKKSLLYALQGNSVNPDLDKSETENTPEQTLELTAEEEPIQSQLLRQEWLDYQSKLSALKSQVQEREAAITSAEAQVKQLTQTLPLIEKRTAAMKNLVVKQLVSEVEYLELEQERIEQQQSLASLKAQKQQHQAALETAIQQLRALQAETIATTLENINTYQQHIHSLAQEVAKATDLNAKQILYAPADGTVQQLAVHTVGGVVTDAQVLMQLVPKDDHLEVEAILENKDIGFVFESQAAEIKVNTFNFTKYGIIDAEVIDVTSDAVIDEVKGLVYKLRLKLDQSQMQIDGRTVDLLPGMSVMAEVKTGKRRLIEYVMSPLLKKASESAKER